MKSQVKHMKKQPGRKRNHKENLKPFAAQNLFISITEQSGFILFPFAHFTSDFVFCLVICNAKEWQNIKFSLAENQTAIQ